MKNKQAKPNQEAGGSCVTSMIRKATSGWVNVKKHQSPRRPTEMGRSTVAGACPKPQMPNDSRSAVNLRQSGCIRVAIFESELLAMATDIHKWEGVETGGLLYGAYSSPLSVVVMLATTSGPRTVREPSRLLLDLEHAELADEVIVARTGQTCIGRWHDHLTSGRCQPSYTDDNSRASLLGHNDRDAFLDFILGKDPLKAAGLRLYPHAQLGHDGECGHASVRVLEGYSPIRRFLLGASALPMDDLFRGWRTDLPVTIEPPIEDSAERSIIGMIESQIRDLPSGMVQDLSVLLDDAGIAVRMSVGGRSILVGYARSIPPCPVSVATLSQGGEMDEEALRGKDLSVCALRDIVSMLDEASEPAGVPLAGDDAFPFICLDSGPAKLNRESTMSMFDGGITRVTDGNSDALSGQGHEEHSRPTAPNEGSFQ